MIDTKLEISIAFHNAMIKAYEGQIFESERSMIITEYEAALDAKNFDECNELIAELEAMAME